MFKELYNGIIVKFFNDFFLNCNIFFSIIKKKKFFLSISFLIGLGFGLIVENYRLSTTNSYYGNAKVYFNEEIFIENFIKNNLDLSNAKKYDRSIEERIKKNYLDLPIKDLLEELSEIERKKNQVNSQNFPLIRKMHSDALSRIVTFRSIFSPAALNNPSFYSGNIYNDCNFRLGRPLHESLYVKVDHPTEINEIEFQIKHNSPELVKNCYEFIKKTLEDKKKDWTDSQTKKYSSYLNRLDLIKSNIDNLIVNLDENYKKILSLYLPRNLEFVNTSNDKYFREKLIEKINSEQSDLDELFYSNNQNKNYQGISNEDHIIQIIEKYLKIVIDENNIKLKEKDIVIPPLNRKTFNKIKKMPPPLVPKYDMRHSFSKEIVIQVVREMYSEIENLKFLFINLSQSAESQNFYDYNEIKIYSISKNKSFIPIIFSLFSLILGIMIIFYKNTMEKR